MSEILNLVNLAEETTNQGGIPWWTTLIYIVAIGALFYFLMYRPQKKKDKQKKDMLSSMKKGDKVTTIGGIQGRVAQIKDDTVILEVASMGTEKVKQEFQRWAIGSVDTESDD